MGHQDKRLYNRLGAICTFANLDGAFFVFLYLNVIAPSDGRTRVRALAVVIFVAYAIGATVLEAMWSIRSWDRTLQWRRENRLPTEAEQRATLRLPLHEAARSFVAWAVAC